MVEKIAKISFSFQKDSEILNSSEFSEKGNLTFTENAIYMGLGSGRTLKYTSFIKDEYYKKYNIDRLLINKLDEGSVYSKEEVDSKLMNLKTRGIVDLSNYYNKQQVDVRLEDYVSKKDDAKNVRYLGSVDNIEALNALKEPKLGDMRTVTSTKDNYVYSGDEWVKMMGIVDLSAYFTQAEINAKLDEKADKDNTYTKDEINSKLDEKVNVTDYTNAMDLKLNSSKILDYYNKEEINNKLDEKLSITDSMTKEDLENSLNLKADKSNTYTIEKIDKFIDSKADKDNTYTKTELVDLLATKSNRDDTYTKLESDYELSNFQFPELNIGESYIKNKVYSFEEDNEQLFFIPIKDGADFDGSVSKNPNFITICPLEKLKFKADKADTYTKDEVRELIKEALDVVLKKEPSSSSSSSSTSIDASPNISSKPVEEYIPNPTGPIQKVPDKTEKIEEVKTDKSEDNVVVDQQEENKDTNVQDNSSDSTNNSTDGSTETITDSENIETENQESNSSDSTTEEVPQSDVDTNISDTDGSSVTPKQESNPSVTQ